MGENYTMYVMITYSCYPEEDSVVTVLVRIEQGQKYEDAKRKLMISKGYSKEIRVSKWEYYTIDAVIL